jgi:hypothetical protein
MRRTRDRVVLGAADILEERVLGAHARVVQAAGVDGGVGRQARRQVTHWVSLPGCRQRCWAHRAAPGCTAAGSRQRQQPCSSTKSQERSANEGTGTRGVPRRRLTLPK